MTLANRFFLIPLILLLVSCGTAHQGIQKSQEAELPIEKREHSNSIEAGVAQYARGFLGTPYKYGGNSKKGMDCSGLVYTSYMKENIKLPRTSGAMALQGKPISLSQAQSGDLLFFGTSKNRKVVNHVGLVVESSPEELLFIHSTTSRGVIISSLQHGYWRERFVMVRSLF